MTLTVFSWGYDGWGNATSELKQAVDAVERSRGFKSPFFVDIRIQRSARAKGFSGTNFEKHVGYDRYVWMDDLGNRAIQTQERGIDIKNPRAAEVLLTLALANARQRRRLIFFCHCRWPVWPDVTRYTVKDATCHRVKVASLLRSAARRRGIALEIVEWPGGSVRSEQLKLSPEEFRRTRNAATIRLGTSLPSSRLLGLPWGSIVEVSNGEDSERYFSGPAKFQASQWALEKLYDGLERPRSKEMGLAAGRAWRRRWGFDSRKSH